MKQAKKRIHKSETPSPIKVNRRGVPEHFSRYYWDCNFENISWRKHKEDMVLRVLTRGTWDDIQWIRNKVGDAWLKAWLMKRRGRALDRPDLRLWGLILSIPERTVTSWLDDPNRKVWDQRLHPVRNSRLF